MSDRRSDARCELLSGEIVGHLVGVIDLKHGRAVHAVAGNRDQYAAVSISTTSSGCSPLDGDAISLAKRYRELGLTSLYIADLDAIETQSLQMARIRQILTLRLGFRTIMVDIGWTGKEDSLTRSAIFALAEEFSMLRIVAATESATSLDAIGTLTDSISAARIVLSLDYRGGRLISEVADETTWIETAQQWGIGGVLVLDLQAVGTSAGVATAEICQRVKRRNPKTAILSGGGIRSADDVRQLIHAGCDSCLVATALL